jgi:putative RecB family exonuclease
MAIYSHSRLETFEQCRLKFKYRYIDKIIPDIPKGIEAHLGSVVHETLEWLYTKVMGKTIPSVNELIDFYSEKWIEQYSKDMPIVKKENKPEDYFNKGVEFLVNYYLKHQPFKDNTIGVEEKIEIILSPDGKTRLIGYIDRLVHDLEKDEIEIHDYKTSASVWSKEKIENSRQLALYSLAIKEIFGKNKKVSLVWHFLAHDMKISINRTNEQLEKLKREVIELINQIESTKNFPPTKSILCNWCEYRNICEAWKTKGNQTLF